jgi:hypothetical protein
MTMDGGIVHGRVPRMPPQRRGRVHLVALPSALVAMVVAGVVIASLGLPRGDGERSADVLPAVSPTGPSVAPGVSPSPAPSPIAESATPAPSDAPLTASPPPDLVIAADATPIAGVDDPHQLPRFPGSEVVGIEEGIDGTVGWTLIEYAAVDVAQDEVREHYRTVFRESDWLVGDVDFVDGVWTFAASDDVREAKLEISVDGDDTVRVSAYVTEIEPLATRSPTPRATRQRERVDRRDRVRPRVNRQRPAPNRDRHIPRYRGDDDDGDDDGDD